MKSTLRLLIPIIALVGVVFGITFITQYIPPTEEDPKGTKGNSDNEPPLRFFSSTRAWNPPSLLSPSSLQVRDYRGLPMLAPSATPIDPDFPFNFSPQDRVFPGFYEVQSDAAGPKHTANFWFENPHAKRVSMELKYVSCGACSGGRVASIPPDVTRQLLEMSRISILPQGLVTALPTAMAGPAANLQPERLDWTHYTFKDAPNVLFKIPPANNPDGWTPQWGILELQFSVGELRMKPLTVDFLTVVEGSQQPEVNRFVIISEGVNAFDLTKERIDLGEMNEKSEPRKFEIIVYSSTRGPLRTGLSESGDLAAPTATVRMPLAQGGDPGQFIAISPPERVPESELGQIADQVSEINQRQRFARVEAAYRYTVTVNPRIGDKSIDIGLLEREIWFTLSDSEKRALHLRGMVTGVVWLDDNLHEISILGTKYFSGESKIFKLITARPDLRVTLLDKECKPDYLKVTLEKDPKPATTDRGYHILTVRVPSNKESTVVRPGTYSGEIVLEVTGLTTQRIRIPVKGRIDPR